MSHRRKLEDRPEWRCWTTPSTLKNAPIHRWFVFPHSFTKQLVHALTDEWGLDRRDRILDPFAGAGTTLLAAKEKDIPAAGYDLSPLAVLASKTKLANYNMPRLRSAWERLRANLETLRFGHAASTYPDLVQRALPGKLLGALETVHCGILGLKCSEAERRFFFLALLGTIPHYSRAVATGGWLSWVDKRTNSRGLVQRFTTQVDLMLRDLSATSIPRRSCWSAEQADVRTLPDEGRTFSAVITSPPYPNRHDYTRVFGVELMFGLLDWESTRELRYQSFHSHPEANPRRPASTGYAMPRSLERTISRLRHAAMDERIVEMLEGYFRDMYLCMRAIKRVCRKGANIALVLGNARYGGEAILVDELTAEIGEQVGLRCEKMLVARYRNNSAQQMGLFGREPSRETIVFLKR
jgi:hypothetical protein